MRRRIGAIAVVALAVAVAFLAANGISTGMRPQGEVRVYLDRVTGKIICEPGATVAVPSEGGASRRERRSGWSEGELATFGEAQRAGFEVCDLCKKRGCFEEQVGLLDRVEMLWAGDPRRRWMSGFWAYTLHPEGE